MFYVLMLAAAVCLVASWNSPWQWQGYLLLLATICFEVMAFSGVLK